MQYSPVVEARVGEGVVEFDRRPAPSGRDASVPDTRLSDARVPSSRRWVHPERSGTEA